MEPELFVLGHVMEGRSVNPTKSYGSDLDILYQSKKCKLVVAMFMPSGH